MTPEADAILSFWFEGEPDRFRERWFKAEPAFDAAIRARFAGAWEAAREGAFRDWAKTSAGALALLLLLDQFPRNLHRGSARAFATDAAARAVAEDVLARALDRPLRPVERIFIYLPFEHAESPSDQERSVALFEALAAEAAFPKAPETVDFARRHRDVIRRFGRFPHRNVALGRASTPAELAWLAEHEGGF